MSFIEREIGAVFLAVKDIEKAKDWYNDLLGIEENIDIQFGHLYVIPSSNLVLDSKIYSKRHQGEAPLFHFNTKNIQMAYEECKKKNVEILTDIEHGQWFNFRDPDGNVLMICQC
ncbi:VOC family protein [Evansella cellulosilytica]|uniref:Glyoxalase/bleomycin resistance protein/dioxygenase n=1 Tax=Evansella cellulosilytica (strain ATCC 21833 / DSM 2522 / FERM P-1141 / JCM 9156 / N-4) TaxID=649639 RepID=E6TSL6_EVAC2|nr:VOC family protein [Evansella cellulosilytica]ADU29524.1 Glyoxalase/bleomycin resistance protein/dioxygenase [Evansella cellulosilytica DSM 2522]